MVSVYLIPTDWIVAIGMIIFSLCLVCFAVGNICGAVHTIKYVPKESYTPNESLGIFGVDSGLYRGNYDE